MSNSQEFPNHPINEVKKSKTKKKTLMWIAENPKHNPFLY